jgi:hypothetical protein
VDPLAPVVLLGELHVPEELGVHPLGAHVSLPLGLFDAVPVGLVGGVVSARVLLLRKFKSSQFRKRNVVWCGVVWRGVAWRGGIRQSSKINNTA